MTLIYTYNWIGLLGFHTVNCVCVLNPKYLSVLFAALSPDPKAVLGSLSGACTRTPAHAPWKCTAGPAPE